MQGVTLDDPDVVVQFVQGELFGSIRTRVSRRLGLDYVLSSRHFKHLTRACSFGYAIDGVSPWCAAFRLEELEILEFYEDLDDFYKGKERLLSRAPLKFAAALALAL